MWSVRSMVVELWTPALPTPADIDRESAISPYLERLCFKSKTAWCGVVKHSCGGASQRAGKYLGQKSRKVELSPFLLPTILDPLKCMMDISY